MDTITTSLNKSKDEEPRVTCKRCVHKTRHKVLQDVETKFETAFGEYTSIDKYQIVQCQGCEEVSFRKLHSDSENFIEHEGETFHPETEELYPPRVAGRHELRQAYFLPMKVSQIYNETNAALCNKQPILSGIGIRALVESVCRDNNAKGRDLEHKIDSLVTDGVLTQSAAEILHSTRILGNKSAHEVEPHSEQTLLLAMDIVENLLTNVYILPKAAKALPRREPN
jgi:hypothetical protein